MARRPASGRRQGIVTEVSSLVRNQEPVSPCFSFAALRVPLAVPEYRFAPPRRWRFDWAWPDKKVALEVDGGAWIGGRHTRGAGFIKDCEKMNAAVLLGWRVLRVTPQQMDSGEAAELVNRLLTRDGKENDQP